MDSSACTIIPAGSGGPKIEVLTKKDIPEGTDLKIQIVGTKNSDFVGQTTLGDFKIKIETPLIYSESPPGSNTITSGRYEIHAADFDPVTFVTERTSSVLYMDIKSTSDYQGVNSDYVFSL